MNTNHLALVTAITIIAATAAYNPANAEDIKLKCTVVTPPHDAPKVMMQGTPIETAPSSSTAFPLDGATQVQVDTQPLDVGADMTPHKELTGADLMVWNKFCKGQDPKKVFEWRYGKCSSLDATFAR